MRVPDGAARQTKPTRSEAIKAQNPADAVARRGRQPNPDGRHSLVQSSTSAGSLPVAFGRPPQLVCVVATSQVEGAFGRVVVAVVRCSTTVTRTRRSASTGIPSAAFRLVVVVAVRCLRSCRRRRFGAPRAVTRTTTVAFGSCLRRPLGCLPVAFGHRRSPSRCGASGRVVVAGIWCSQGRRRPRRSALGRALRRPPGSFPAASVSSSSPRCGASGSSPGAAGHRPSDASEASRKAKIPESKTRAR